jgi:ribose transport system permease protein
MSVVHSPQGASADPAAAAPAWWRRSGSGLGLPLVLLAIIVIGGLTTPGFLTADNARAILINASVVGIAAVGMTPVTLSGNFISLGVQQTAVLAAVVFLALLDGGWPVLVALLVTVTGLLAIGVVQGLVVAAGLNPVITTLAAGAVIFGVVTAATGGQVVTAPGVDLAWVGNATLLGLPVAVYAFVLFTALITWMMTRTIVGRRVLLLGANRATARLSGVPVRATTVAAFIALSLGAALAGVITAAQLGQATSSDLSDLTINVVVAVLVGGTAIAGGEGSALRSAVGAVIIAMANNLMLLQNLPTGGRLALTGVLAAAVVTVLQLLRSRGVR